MTCTACTEAQTNPHCGKFDRGCRACNVRHVAQMPPVRRQLYFDSLSFDNREAFKAEVREEFRRLRAMVKP